MKHREVIAEIEKFVFLGAQLNREVVEHIEECYECRKYYENALRFSSGVSKLRKISSELSEEIKFDKKKVDLVLSERVVRSLLLKVFVESFRKVLVGVLVVILFFGVSFLGSFLLSSYFLNRNVVSGDTNSIIDDETSYVFPSYQELLNYSSYEGLDDDIVDDLYSSSEEYFDSYSYQDEYW